MNFSVAKLAESPMLAKILGKKRGIKRYFSDEIVTMSLICFFFYFHAQHRFVPVKIGATYTCAMYAIV